MQTRFAEADAVILVIGEMHSHVWRRLEESFLVESMPDSSQPIPDNVSASEVRGIATSQPLEPGLIASFPMLEIIAIFGAGYDGLDAEFAASLGVIVTNTPDVLTTEVADRCVGLLLNTVYQLSRAEAWLREGRWSQGQYPLTPSSLHERSIGILGLGRIGKAVAQRLEAFGLPIAYHNRSRATGIMYPYYESALALAEAVDTMIVLLPGGLRTKDLVSLDVLRALGPHGIVINMGRGSAIAEDDLILALEERLILAAGLDVYANEPFVPPRLTQLPNAVLLPHVGSASIRTRTAMADLVVDNLYSWFKDGRVVTPVPETAHSQLGGVEPLGPSSTRMESGPP